MQPSMMRVGSRLARLAAITVEKHGGTVDLAFMEDFDCPSYNQNSEGRQGFPPGAAEFHRRLEAIVSFISLAEAAKHYLCIKKASVEFLGEQPDPATERVE